jgi:NAD(P)-dependent dehydrogenase (short-subunit alcohol dehydrogenase family)
VKNILIIGASSGIGKQLAEDMAADHNVIGTYHSTDVSNSNNVTYHHLDVNSDFDLSFLPEVLDALVYCPGSINLLPFRRIKAEAFIEDFNLQVLGAIKTIQQCFTRLRKSDNPSIVLFSTVAVQAGYNFHSQVAVSKGAIEGLTRSLAAEFAPTIRVNCIAPSLTDTPLASGLLNTDQKKEANAQRHPLKRIGTTKDISNAAKFLLSDNSSWITGQILQVDGGMSSVK